MERQNCNAYTVGFCPNEEFYCESITVRCPLPHVNTDRVNYAAYNQTHPFEAEVLENYKAILTEVKKKTELREYILSKDIIDDSYYSALSKCETILDLKAIKQDDFENTHSLLQIHGNLIKNVLSSDNNSKKYSVCQNCGAFYEDSKCNHMFCGKYKLLREMITKLENKLSGSLKEK